MGLIIGLQISYKKDTDVLSNIWISKILNFFLLPKYTVPADKSLGQLELHKSFDGVLSNTQQYTFHFQKNVGQKCTVSSGSL